MSNTEAFGRTHRVLVINPWTPARTELIGTNAKQASSLDVGKPVKLSGVSTALCVNADEIYGFIESVEAGADQYGYSHGGVLCDRGCEVYAKDEAGTLVVGDLVMAGTVTAFGTQLGVTGANVKKAAGMGIHNWQVMAKYTTGAYAGSVLLRKI